MLRITSYTKDFQTILELEGRLAGPWVAELKQAWEAEQGAGRPIVVNLASVSYVDADGKSLLSDMCRAGIGFEASGCLMRSLVDDMTRVCHDQAGMKPRSPDEGCCEGG
jgi:hypothetical protein